MFNLFKKKEDTVKVIDKIWMTQEAKWQGILDLWKKDPSIVIITWFSETSRRLTELFAKQSSLPVSIFMAREVHGRQLTGKNIVLAEHYPIRTKEQDSFKQWHLSEAVVHSAMDEPLFLHFGGEKIMSMMKQLGMKEDTVIEHKMISSSIENAQEKIEKKVMTELLANSQKEWMERNL